MNNTEEQHPVFIPRNFIEKGTFMGGMFKIRNAIEGGILAILITIPVINLPLTLTVRIAHFTRDEINSKILELGAKAGSSVTKKTDYLICGEKAGSKLAKAQSLGIKILSEDEFLEMIA